MWFLLLVLAVLVIYKYDYSIKCWLMKQAPIKNYLLDSQMAKACKYSKLVSRHVEPGGRILDFGTATGCMTKVLREQYKYRVYPLDVIDQTLVDIEPKLYKCDEADCEIPYGNNYFNCGIAMGVLHHTHDPVELLRELQRTCKMIILCEDIYDTEFARYKTYVMDSIVNFEFNGHPHNNRSDSEWRDIFDSLGLELATAYYYDYRFFRHGVYVLYSASR